LTQPTTRSNDTIAVDVNADGWRTALGGDAAAQAIAPDAEVTPTAQAAMAGADLVYLACPPVPRKAYALAAANAGKAVFLEKL